jgi:hypothetical protein
MQNRIDSTRCRALLSPEVQGRLTDEEIVALRDFVYDLAAVVVEAYIDLPVIDQSLFETRPFDPDELNPSAGGDQ